MKIILVNTLDCGVFVTIYVVLGDDFYDGVWVQYPNKVSMFIFKYDEKIYTNEVLFVNVLTLITA